VQTKVTAQGDYPMGQSAIVGFNYLCPKSWALCDGQLLAISQNQALFSLEDNLWAMVSTFALPDLRGRANTCR
jgi:microcystin-dependent protein